MFFDKRFLVFLSEGESDARVIADTFFSSKIKGSVEKNGEEM
jgi:hypothetical protein